MNGFLKTLAKPDWDDSPTRSEILNAANILQIGEFQLIQLAYKVWYREELPEDRIDKIFSEYMVTGIIPIWVTFYARDILKLDKANVLNSYDEKQRRTRGILYATIVIFVFIATHFWAASYFEEPAGFYPPYIEKSVVYPELYKNKK